MKLIVGLGNPGKKYERTRHNVGFMALDAIAKELGANFQKTKWNGEIAQSNIQGQKYILAKPHTFMNLSGEFVRKVVDYYKIDIKDILVIHDDKDMDAGKLKFKNSGSSGGQNGIRNIILHLNTQNFSRIKVGVGRPMGDTAAYVLSPFNAEQKPIIVKSIDSIVKSIDLFIKNDFNHMANKRG